MDEDELDPRIQVELEKLNTATDEINKLEIELDEANTTFRMLLNECTRRLKVHSSKFGSAIVSARPYYEALDVARVAQQECQRAAVGFQRANEVHEAAKETVALAETRFLSQPEWRFDSAWQEMLNHATLKVRDAEKQRAESAAYHGQATARYKQAQDKVQQLDQRLHRNVAKSRPYFEEKMRCNDQLAAQKAVVEALQNHVAEVKAGYADSLRRLEGISEEIHRKRADILAECRGVREPGVGAELEYEGELQDLEALRHTLDAHHSSRSPDGDAKTTLPPGTSRLRAKDDSTSVHDHFAGLEETPESGDAPQSSDHKTKPRECAQVPDVSEDEDFAAQSSSETKPGNEIIISELKIHESKTEVVEERRSSQVDGEPSTDSVIIHGAVTADVEAMPVVETRKDSLKTIDKSNFEVASNYVDQSITPSDLNFDSKIKDTKILSNVIQEKLHIQKEEVRTAEACLEVDAENLSSNSRERKEQVLCTSEDPTDKTKARRRELTQDNELVNLTKHNTESTDVHGDEVPASEAQSTNGSRENSSTGE